MIYYTGTNADNLLSRQLMPSFLALTHGLLAASFHMLSARRILIVIELVQLSGLPYAGQRQHRKAGKVYILRS